MDKDRETGSAIHAESHDTTTGVRITPDEIAEARWWSEALLAERAREWFTVVVLDVPESVVESIAGQIAEHGDLLIRYLDRWAVLIRMNVLTVGRMLARRWVGHIPNAGVGVADSHARTGPLGSKMPLADMLAVAFAESLVCRTGA